MIGRQPRSWHVYTGPTSHPLSSARRAASLRQVDQQRHVVCLVAPGSLNVPRAEDRCGRRPPRGRVAAEAAALAVAIAERRLELTAGAPGARAGPGSGAPTRRCARKAARSPSLRTTHIRFRVRVRVRVRVTAVFPAGAHETPAQDENRTPPTCDQSLSL